MNYKKIIIYVMILIMGIFIGYKIQSPDTIIETHTEQIHITDNATIASMTIDNNILKSRLKLLGEKNSILMVEIKKRKEQVVSVGQLEVNISPAEAKDKPSDIIINTDTGYIAKKDILIKDMPIAYAKYNTGTKLWDTGIYPWSIQVDVIETINNRYVEAWATDVTHKISLPVSANWISSPAEKVDKWSWWNPDVELTVDTHTNIGLVTTFAGNKTWRIGGVGIDKGDNYLIKLIPIEYNIWSNTYIAPYYGINDSKYGLQLGIKF